MFGASGDLSPKAWKIFNDPENPGNFTVLRKNEALLKKVAKLQSKYPDIDWNRIAINSIGSVEPLFDILDKLADKNIENFRHVLADLASGGNNYVGARFVMDYVKSRSDVFINSITKFEAYANDGAGNVRYYDIELGAIKIECKRWLTFYPSKFAEQFLKDLTNMKELGQIQWKFKKTGEISDLTNLKNKVLNALGSFDNSTNKWVAGDGLKGLFSNDDAVHNIQASFGAEIENADLLINKLSGSSFDSIFEIIN